METGFHYDKNKLSYDYLEAAKDPDFKKLVARVKASDDIAMRYTSKFERAVSELRNCAKCKGLSECKNPCKGYVTYPRVDGKIVYFDSKECKYKAEEAELEKNSSKFFNEPLQIRTASMKNVDISDKNRVATIKWVNKFYKDYKKNKNIKGLYLHGSFGAGKTYIISAMLNQLASEGNKCVIAYYPQLLKTLKESFNKSFDEDYDEVMQEITECDILLIDDIGAENVTAWSRDDVLGPILQYRMDNVLPTFFTSNLNAEELEAHLAETKNNVDIVKAKRIMSRINFLSEDIEMISQNRRV